MQATVGLDRGVILSRRYRGHEGRRQQSRERSTSVLDYNSNPRQKSARDDWRSRAVSSRLMVQCPSVLVLRSGAKVET
jgi:hypothetical protein